MERLFGKGNREVRAFDDELGFVFMLSYWTTVIICFVAFAPISLFPPFLLWGIAVSVLLLLPCGVFFILFFKAALLLSNSFLPFILACAFSAAVGSWLCLYFAMAADLTFSPFSLTFDFSSDRIQNYAFLRWLAAAVTALFAILLKPGYETYAQR